MAAPRVSFLRVVGDVVQSAGGMLALAVLATAPACCFLGLPIFWSVAGAMYLRVMGVRHADISTWHVGLLGMPIFVTPLVAALLTAWIVNTRGPSESRELVALLATFGLSALLGALLSPLHAAPFAAIEGSPGILDALLTSGAHAARRGLGRTLARGAATGLVGATPWLVPALTRAVDPEPGALVLAPLLGAAYVAVLLNLSSIAQDWGEGVQRFGAARTLHTASPPRVAARARLVGSLAIAAGAVLLVGSALTLALLTPTGAWRREPGPLRGEPLVDSALEGSEEGITVRPEGASRWSIATADGGGAGLVRFPHGVEASATLSRERYRGEEVWTLRAARRDTVWLVSFDDRGVRVDDTPLDRLEARVFGEGGLAALLAYGAALAALLAFQLRRVGIATGLDHPRFSGDREIAALAGTLRSEGPVPLRGQALALEAPARVELGELGAITLPPGLHPLLVPARAHALEPGASLTIIAPIAGGDRSPFREGSAPLPRGAKLAIGSLEEAREQYAERVARTNVLASLPLLALGLGLATVILTHL
jgi:hypothetical protein